MQPPELTLNEESRLQALRAIGLLGSPPEECFDRVVRLAAQLFDVPIAACTLVDREQQWFKARFGLNMDATPRDGSICGHVIRDPSGELILSDLTKDKRFHDNPLVVGKPHIRFYAGVAITDRSGYRLGALCVMDTKPRRFSDKQRQSLRDLAAIVESELTFIVNGVRVNPVERFQQAESLVSQLFQLSEQFTTVFNHRGMLEMVSPAFTRELGYTLEDLRTKVWMDLIHPDDHERFARAHRLLFDEQKELDFEGRCRHKNGHYIWTQWRAAAAIDNGKVYTVGRNSSEDKKREELVESTNLMLRAVNDSLTQFVQDRKSRNPFEILLDNMLQVSNSEFGFLGEVHYDGSGSPLLKTYAITNIAWSDETRTFYDTYVEEGLEFTKLKSLFGAVLTSGEIVFSDDPATDPRRCGLPPGHPPLHAFLGIPIFSGGSMTGMVGLANRPGGFKPNVVESLELVLAAAGNLIMAFQAERKHMASQQALANSETITRTTLSSLADGVVTINQHYIIQTSNLAFKTMFGLSEEATQGKSLTDVMSIKEESLAFLSNSDVKSIVISGVHSAGNIFPIELRAASMYLEDALQWVVVVRDISEWKWQEDKLREAGIAAEAANKAKTMYLGKMSHEIRTPLNGIIGMAELALDLAILEDQKSHLQSVLKSSRILTQLVN